MPKTIDAEHTCGGGDVFNPGCPSRAVLEMLAEKWALLVVHTLANGPARTSQLRRQVGGISEKMLIQTLRRLERSGFVSQPIVKTSQWRSANSTDTTDDGRTDTMSGCGPPESPLNVSTGGHQWPALSNARSSFIVR